MQCIPSWLRKRKKMVASNSHPTNALELEEQRPDATDFDSLPGETKRQILSLLPVVDVVRGRAVCREWREILSSSSRRSSRYFPRPPSSSSCRTDFWKHFWLENRPWERWLFLHNGHLVTSLLYDVQRGICYQYPACPKLPRARELQNLASYQDVANTSAIGLVFLVTESAARYSFGPPVPRIWTYNPLTGCGTPVPDVEIPWHSWTMFALEDVSSRINGPHFKLLLLGQTPFPEEHLCVLLYSSKDKRWENHESARVRRGWCYLEVSRFYEHGSIAILEVAGGSAPSPNVRLYNFYRQPSLQITPFRAEADCYLKWFDFENYTWNSCPIFPPEDLLFLFNLKHFYLFDRNKELVLLAGLLCPREFALDFRVYKSTSTITPGRPPSWRFLCSMPASIAQSSGCRPFARTRFRIRKLSECQAFPLPDKILGDKLVIILFENDSFSVVSFNLESLEWRTVTATPDLGVPYLCIRERTPSEEKIGSWTRVTSEAMRSNLLCTSTYQSGSLRGFSHEPRLHDG